MKVQSYRFHCRNAKCGSEFLRAYRVDEFEKNQYSTANGWSCFNCGFPKMAVMKSKRMADDGFKPGFQRNIRKHCETYTQYKNHLKEMGLVEMGYDDIDENAEGEPVKYWTDDILKKVYDHGIDISGREAQALKNGMLNE